MEPYKETINAAVRDTLASIGGPDAFFRLLKKDNWTFQQHLQHLIDDGPKHGMTPEKCAYFASEEFKQFYAALLGLM